MCGSCSESTFEDEDEDEACVYLKTAGGEVRLEIEDSRMSFEASASPGPGGEVEE